MVQVPSSAHLFEAHEEQRTARREAVTRRDYRIALGLAQRRTSASGDEGVEDEREDSRRGQSQDETVARAAPSPEAPTQAAAEAQRDEDAPT